MCNDWSYFDFCTLDNVPDVPGVYFLMNDDELVYIGQSKNIRKRIVNHKSKFNCTDFLGKEPLYPDMFNSLFYFECNYKPERKEYESMFLEDSYPKLNGNDWVVGERQIFDNIAKDLEKKNKEWRKKQEKPWLYRDLPP